MFHSQVRVRLEQFHANAKAVAKFYAKQRVTVDGARNKDAVYSAVRAAVAAARARVDGVVEVATQPIEGMKMGTSGLRKPVRVLEENDAYLKNFVQVRSCPLSAGWVGAGVKTKTCRVSFWVVLWAPLSNVFRASTTNAFIDKLR